MRTGTLAFGLMTITLAGGLAMAAAGLRVNATPSMPIGVWRIDSATAPAARGDIVVVCLPALPGARQGFRRGYLGAGLCPDKREPLVKPIAAVDGDLVTISEAGIAVNGHLMPHIEALEVDDAGRRLRFMPDGAYRVEPGQVWLLSGHDSRSFDSRYFGPVPVAAIRGRAQPVLVFR